MPFGLGLHVLVALVCAVHVVRSGQPLYWLLILFAFPLLGSAVYVVAVWLPNAKIERRAVRATGSVVRALDPQRAIREARAALDETPTAQNQMRLAAALLEAGQGAEAAEWYERCLQGPFAADPDIRLGAARALLAGGRPAEALAHLATIRQARPDFRMEVVALLTAGAEAAAGRPDAARAEYESAIARFGTFEARADYAIWARSAGDVATADRLDAEIGKIVERWNGSTRALNADTLRRWRATASRAR